MPASALSSISFSVKPQILADALHTAQVFVAFDLHA